MALSTKEMIKNWVDETNRLYAMQRELEKIRSEIAVAKLLVAKHLDLIKSTMGGVTEQYFSMGPDQLVVVINGNPSIKGVTDEL